MSGNQLQIASCTRCSAFSFPANVPGCRVCGAEPALLRQVDCPAPPRLRNFVTVHADIVPGLGAPCIIGDVELAPGIVEEAIIEAPNEARLSVGILLEAVYQPGSNPGDSGSWRFIAAKDAR
jgi:hypothetical protein